VLTSLLPFLARLPLLHTPPTRRQLSPADTASRFQREFEEVYGPQHIPFEPARGYAECTRRAKDEDRYLLVVLLSEVHDDTTSFCSDVLCDETFREWVREHEVICWAGNVADSEAHTGTTAPNTRLCVCGS
jgi:FAS-associated factor 2